MARKTMKFSCFILAFASMAPQPAAAQELPAGDRNISIGVGIQTKPVYPGADSNRFAFFPRIDVWRDGEPIIAKSPDESFGPSLIGKRSGRFAAGPTLNIAATRSADDLPGLAKIGFGIEAGAFAEAWPLGPLRLRGELRQGIGAHKALTGDLAADLVWRRGKEGPIFTAGPRVRWGSAKHNRAYFGVPAGAATALSPYEPGAGIYAVGAAAGLRYPLNRTVGLYGFAGYDRLTGKAADSPIVTAGNTDQFSGGIALTYRFGL